MSLVQSQETRRIIDRIMGFKLSTLLKNKIGSISAGRVQSVTLKLITDREKEISEFIPREYWNLDLDLENADVISAKIESALNDMKKACNTLIDKGAENVLLSLGRDGAILTDGSNTYFCKSAAVAVNSAVGAGDSMVAAAAVMTERGESKEEILRSSVAAGTASIITPGTNLFYRYKYE